MTAPASVAFLSTARDVVGGAEEGMLGILRYYPEGSPAPVLLARAGGELEAWARECDVGFAAWRPEPLPLGIRGAKAVQLPLRLRRGARALRERLGALRSVLVTTHSIEAHLYGALASRRLGLPLVWHVRDVHAPAGERWALRLAGWSHAPHPAFLSEAARRSYPIRRRRGSAGAAPQGPVIADGVDLARFPSRQPAGPIADPVRRAKEPFTLAFVGQLLPRKGLDVLFDALDQLGAGHAEVAGRVRLRVAGEAPGGETDGFREALLHRIESPPWAARVRFLGRVRPVGPLLEQIDALVLPSRDEALGLVALEAMAAGRPVIASSDAGIAEAVRHEREGLLVPAGNPGALANAILRLATDPGFARRLGRAGFQRVREHFDARRQAGAVAAFHRAVILDWRRSPRAGSDGAHRDRGR